MSWRLEGITDWPERACRANWSVQRLAEQCNVGVRTLQRYFLERMGQSPQSWMNHERQRRAIELLRDGSTVKETAAILGYENQQAFARGFKNHYGMPPYRHRELGNIEEAKAEK